MMSSIAAAKSQLFQGEGKISMRLLSISNGAFTLMRRAAGRIDRYPSGHHGIATTVVAERALADAEAVEKGELATGEDARFDPLPLRA